MEKQILGALGQVIIFDDEQDMTTHIDPVKVDLASGQLIPGEMTTVGGYWSSDLKFLGILKEDPRICVFYVGIYEDVFEKCILCDFFYKIDHNRLFKKGTDRSGRDHNWIKGKWK